MSTFWGYIFEGTVFLVLYLWWVGHTFIRTIKCESEGKKFTPRLTYPIPGTKIPGETLFKLFISGIGFLATLFYDGVAWTDESGNYRKMSTVITMSVYAIFFLHSLVELLLWHGVPLIKNSDYVTAAIGCMWYAMASYFRAHDFMLTAGVSYMCKIFPMFPMAGTGVCIAIEAAGAKNFWTQMLRVICMGLMASWNWNAGFILHDRSSFPGSEPNPVWNQQNHDNTAFIGAAFGDHLCFHFIFLILLYQTMVGYARLKHGIRLEYNAD